MPDWMTRARAAGESALRSRLPTATDKEITSPGAVALLGRFGSSSSSALSANHYNISPTPPLTPATAGAAVQHRTRPLGRSISNLTTPSNDNSTPIFLITSLLHQPRRVFRKPFPHFGAFQALASPYTPLPSTVISLFIHVIHATDDGE